jgi:predicted ATPase
VSGRFVLTGAPGSGKTPVLHELVGKGFVGVAEPARRVLAEQRSTGGEGVPEKDPALFCALMLSLAISDFCEMEGSVAFFDRGIPDQIGYAELFDLDSTDAERAAELHRYNEMVFVMPSWPEIYTTDDERKMAFEAAEAFGLRVREVYAKLGYTLVDVPRDTPQARARIIAAHLDDR